MEYLPLPKLEVAHFRQPHSADLHVRVPVPELTPVQRRETSVGLPRQSGSAGLVVLEREPHQVVRVPMSQPPESGTRPWLQMELSEM